MALDIQLAAEGSGRRRGRLTGRLDTVSAPELDARLATVQEWKVIYPFQKQTSRT